MSHMAQHPRRRHSSRAVSSGNGVWAQIDFIFSSSYIYLLWRMYHACQKGTWDESDTRDINSRQHECMRNMAVMWLTAYDQHTNCIQQPFNITRSAVIYRYYKMRREGQASVYCAVSSFIKMRNLTIRTKELKWKLEREKKSDDMNTSLKYRFQAWKSNSLSSEEEEILGFSSDRNNISYSITQSLYRVSTTKRLDFIVFSGNNE
jgi:hypothetical protein